MKTLFFQCFQGTLTHDQEVFIPLQLAYKSVKIGKILGDFPVDQCDQKGSSDFFHTFQSFFIIVQICQGNYQLIILILLNIFLKLCLIIEKHCHKINVCIHIFQNTGFIYHIFHSNQLHGNTIDPVSKVGAHLCDLLFLRYRQFIRCDFRKNSGNVLVIQLFFPGKLCKHLVRPDHSSIGVHNGIGKSQIIQKTLLKRFILIGKRDQIIENQRSVKAGKQKCCHNIYHNSKCSKNSCFHTYHKNKNIQPYKKNGQIQWPPHELLHGSLEFQFFIHKFILTYKSSGTFYIVTGKIRLCQIV